MAGDCGRDVFSERRFRECGCRLASPFVDRRWPWAVARPEEPPDGGVGLAMVGDAGFVLAGRDSLAKRCGCWKKDTA